MSGKEAMFAAVYLASTALFAFSSAKTLFGDRNYWVLTAIQIFLSLWNTLFIRWIIDKLAGAYISAYDMLTKYFGVIMTDRVWFILFLGASIVVYLAFGLYVAPQSAKEAKRYVDIEPPSVAVEKPDMGETIPIQNNKATINARIIIKDNKKPKSLYISLAKPINGTGTILRDSLQIKVEKADEIENWPTIVMDISDEYTNAEYNLPRKIRVLYDVDYVGGVCVVDLDITIEDLAYYSIGSGEKYWVIFVVTDGSRNYAWNSSLVVFGSGGSRMHSCCFVLPGGSIIGGHPALHMDVPYVPYLERNGQYYTIGKTHNFDEYVYRIQFNLFLSTNNVSVMTGRGELMHFVHVSPNFLAGFLIIIGEDERYRMDEFVGLEHIDFVSNTTVRFEVGAWSPLLTVWACFLYVPVGLIVYSIIYRRQSK